MGKAAREKLLSVLPQDPVGVFVEKLGGMATTWN
jgi:hypothetical protein